VDDWIDRLADALGQEHLTADEIDVVLMLARDVAHGVERRLAPLSTFMAGLYVATRANDGTPRREALARAVTIAAGSIAAGSIPPAPTPQAEGSAGGVG
jgi:hypothetical protein